MSWHMSVVLVNHLLTVESTQSIRCVVQVRLLRQLTFGRYYGQKQNGQL